MPKLRAHVRYNLGALTNKRPRRVKEGTSGGASIELATVARADRKTVRKMLAALMAAGRVQVTGTQARPRYSLITKSDPVAAGRGRTSKVQNALGDARVPSLAQSAFAMSWKLTSSRLR